VASPRDSPLHSGTYSTAHNTSANLASAFEKLCGTLHFAVAEPEHLHELMVGDPWVSFDRLQHVIST